MEDRGFELRTRLEALERDDNRSLSPADRVAERAYFAPPSGGDLPVLEGEEALVFGSNNYLGLTTDERVQRAATQACETVGTGAGSSRLWTGDTLVHHDLERALAETTGTDRTLVCSSRHAAITGAITTLEPDVIFADERTNAGLADACRLVGADCITYDHCNASSLRAQMERRGVSSGTSTAVSTEPVIENGGERGANGAEESWLVVTDSAFGADGTVAPLEDLCIVAETVGAWVLVDETHATGLYTGGGGIVQATGVEDRVHVQIGALSTALASQGGFVAGEADLIEVLLACGRPFTFEAGLAPPAAAAASEALHITRHSDCRERLWENVAHCREGLEAMGLEVLGETQILSVRLEAPELAPALAAELRERGVIVPAIVPPAVPNGTSCLRVTPMATHDPEDIVACLEAIQAAREAVGTPGGNKPLE